MCWVVPDLEAVAQATDLHAIARKGYVGGVKHVECPIGDWSEDAEDDVTGYVDLLLHEVDHHPQPPDSTRRREAS